jgi:hypothetical protein
MGCDIHLRIEKRRRINPYPNDRHEWYNVGIYGEFSSRIYGMFARMAKLKHRNKKNEHYETFIFLDCCHRHNIRGVMPCANVFYM